LSARLKNRISGENMEVSDLFLTEMEPPLNQWIRKFTSPRDLLAALPQLHANLTSQSVQGVIEDGAAIIGPVHIGVGSLVRCQAIIRGPVVVGNDTVVGSHAEIEPGCFIGSKCVIGHGCSIIESMLMNNVVVWAGGFIRNSVLGFGSVIGPGAVLGADKPRSSNAALPTSSEVGVILGDYSAVGANSTLRPGTTVGFGTIIGEGVLAEGSYDSGQPPIRQKP
jgi:UDP-N-acetylglucosamine diphosphorylase / glucose-1-phosphate thymidylyltransferase / UDP-N-acetylgalactosamine diphosphorylase / glucosamine-1-phosphate N-acetyltransferase / galactosamine-1-phosphate N-acetyltransferase